MAYKDFDLEVLDPSDINTYIMQQVIIRCTSATRPASPTEGWHIYETDTKRFLVFRSSAWVREGEQQIAAFKTTSENSTNTTFHSDAALFIPLSANTKYWLDGFIIYTASTTGYNFQYSWTVPSGTTMSYASNHPVLPDSGADAGTYSVGGYNLNKRFFVATDTINCRVFANQYHTSRVRGIVTVGSTVGNLQFQWRTSTAPNATVRANSALVLQAIG